METSGKCRVSATDGMSLSRVAPPKRHGSGLPIARKSRHRISLVLLGGCVWLVAALLQLTRNNGALPGVPVAWAAPDDGSDNSDCVDVPAFSFEDFNEQPDVSLVYTNAAVFRPTSMFRTVGLVRFVRVFGVPIVASSSVGDAALSHAASIFADFLDNDRDGKPDNEDAVNAMRSYSVVLGFTKDAEESTEMWTKRLEQPQAKQFRDQYNCNLRFFELWRSDINPVWHVKRREYFKSLKDQDFVPSSDSTQRRKQCADFRSESFDWPIWYFPFTISYYGLLDFLTDDQVKVLEGAMQKAKRLRKFDSHYDDDAEMEKGDFFAWSLITRIGGTQCHCDASDVGATWKVCTPDEFASLFEVWASVLDTLKGLPKQIYEAMYASPALAGASDS
ncbi:conserved hypothetical protein [Neospora caninum Liverpool]|uniref:Uncharacterized protein n=1 Tax=Neospora caninum (strain Liverpool) TaxID=572307 RepID=F0VLW1_NEOCL|nr:conserved hypothetical protein [Neospora caninum Liverpool]CBZ54239.1 conserved hypothetical protein [Neospora caninum Liverpool]CEL68942.1 TPA: hypothetical protein BN1204_046710 [Neospora caninum Liverpool]|eukprot:XP_003884270.1 conserved hypothetical protein [Neospora caninum Liverpool]